MADVKTLLRLASRRQLDKADVESVYGEIVRVVGGTRFVSGTPTGPNNGLLDFRNFSPNAGITNNNKNEPFAVGTVQLYIRSVGTDTSSHDGNAAFAAAGIGITPTMAATITGWSFMVGTVSGATNNATASVYKVRGAVLTQIGTSAVLVNYNQLTLLKNETGLSVNLEEGDWLKLRFTQSGTPITVNNLVAHIYYKMLHVR